MSSCSPLVLCLAGALALAGCARATPAGDGGSGDLGAALDLSDVDLTTGPDLSRPCTVLPQQYCAAGDKCTLSAGGTECVADGNKSAGALCGATAGTDDCVKGTLCIQESATLNECRPFCAQDTDCSQQAVGGVSTNLGHCLLTLNGSTAKVCTIPCQPAPGAGANLCATGLACQLFGLMSGAQATDCSAPGSGGDGANCPNGNGDCKDGFACVSINMGMANRCRQVCRIGRSADCAGLPSGYGCLAPSSGTPSWGFCCSSTNGC